jgi:preprotein translocase subunit SecF
MQLPNIYEYKNYKLFIIIPIVLVLISIYLLPKVPTGIDLRGGTLITLQTNQSFDENELQAKFQRELGLQDVSIKKLTTPFGTNVEIELEQNEKIADAELNLIRFYSALGDVEKFDFAISAYNAELASGNVTNRDDVINKLNDAQASLSRAEGDMKGYADIVLSDSEIFVGKIDRSNATTTNALKNLVINSFGDAKQSYRNKILALLNSSIKFNSFIFKDVSPSLSEFFVQKTRELVIYSSILTGIVVFLVFRSLVPSITVMLGAFIDIIIALGGMALFQIPLNLPSLATLLLILGYSIDTDILLAVRLLKRTEGNAKERVYNAMTTGVMMAFVSILGFAVLIILSMFTQIQTYYQISTVATVGLFADIIGTWLSNAVILLWYVERKR